jgi:uracil-DNA glycosylase family protein
MNGRKGAEIEAVPVTVKASREEDLMRPAQPLRADSATDKQSRPASREETRHADLARLAADAASCQRCPLYRNATQVVFGEGPVDAALVMIGEQPGDQEDRAGRPFVGPAGRVLDQALSAVGLDRRTVYVTNAVKHFKHEERGKRRLHKHPNRREDGMGQAAKVWHFRRCCPVLVFTTASAV